MRRNSVGALRRGNTAIALILLLAGCSAERDAVVEPPGLGDPTAVVTRVSVAPVEFRAGETVQIEVGVHNPTTLPILLQFNSGCMLSFAVKDSRDAKVAPEDIPCTLDTPTMELAAGETVTWRFSWDGTSRPGTPLPPGDYRVIGGLDPGAMRQPSAPVFIRILGP
jgi:hypothetical protein